MNYQVLARKWRPQDFSSLVGQEPIVTALTNALRDRRIAQAYLFSGIRGVGKTTAARIFAKALNCDSGPTPEPCNTCSTCLEIARGQDLDVLEVDAATYSKVEQVRELTESLRYGPAHDRYKVVVLDEVHRLSRQAFDALLKIIEEPPPHLVFVFATTEIDAVPATILSRCQEFHFRRVTAETVTAHLAALAEAESIEVSPAALRLIARAGEGSVRDAVALLDQLATFGAGRIADEDAARLLGGLDTALFHDLLAALVHGNAGTVTAICREIEERGWDPRRVYAQFLAYCRDGIHLALGAAPSTIDLPAEDAQRLKHLVSETSYDALLRILHQLLDSEATVRRTDAGTLAVEIAWLRACELPRLLRVQRVLSGLEPLDSEGQGGSSSTPSSSQGPTQGAPLDHAGQEQAELSPSAPPPQHSAPVEDVRQAIRMERPALAATLERYAELQVEGGNLLLAVPADDSFAREQIERSGGILDAVASQVLGPSARWRVVARGSSTSRKAKVEPAPRPSEPPPTPASNAPTPGQGHVADAPPESTSAAAPPDPRPNDSGDDPQQVATRPSREEQLLRQRVLQDPTVQAVLDIFGTDIESVELKA